MCPSIPRSRIRTYTVAKAHKTGKTPPHPLFVGDGYVKSAYVKHVCKCNNPNQQDADLQESLFFYIVPSRVRLSR